MRDNHSADFRAQSRARRAAAQERSWNRRFEEADREYLETLLQGVPLPAAHEVVLKYAKRDGPKYAKRDGPKEFAHELRRLSPPRYSTL